MLVNLKIYHDHTKMISMQPTRKISLQRTHVSHFVISYPSFLCVLSFSLLVDNKDIYTKSTHSSSDRRISERTNKLVYMAQVDLLAGTNLPSEVYLCTSRKRFTSFLKSYVRNELPNVQLHQPFWGLHVNATYTYEAEEDCEK